ncbi:MAG: hypothetical protein ACK5U4_04040 [Rhodospirillales bacterium]|jgi:hypothetical protein
MAATDQVKGKTTRPSVYFEEPRDVVADATLSAQQKDVILKTLEQDARQLSDASAEGMGGGERNKLHEVLIAADTLSLQPVANAYETVLVDLRARLGNEGDAVQLRLLKQALASLEALVKTSAKISEAARDVVPIAAQDRA